MGEVLCFCTAIEEQVIKRGPYLGSGTPAPITIPKRLHAVTLINGSPGRVALCGRRFSPTNVRPNQSWSSPLDVSMIERCTACAVEVGVREANAAEG